jgi:hypothetical protein
LISRPNSQSLAFEYRPEAARLRGFLFCTASKNHHAKPKHPSRFSIARLISALHRDGQGGAISITEGDVKWQRAVEAAKEKILTTDEGCSLVI